MIQKILKNSFKEAIVFTPLFIWFIYWDFDVENYEISSILIDWLIYALIFTVPFYLLIFLGKFPEKHNEIMLYNFKFNRNRMIKTIILVSIISSMILYLIYSPSVLELILGLAILPFILYFYLYYSTLLQYKAIKRS